MPAEFDFVSGFDFSSLSSITGAQLMQSINQIAPLSSKGLVIYGSSAPDVGNNARYARYLWIDTSAAPYVVKYYDGAVWTSITIGAGAITNTMIATAAVSLLASDGITYKITRAFNDANDATKARYMLWLDANGKRVEIASLSSVLATSSGTIAGIAGLAAGTDDQVLRMNGAAIQWETLNFASSIADGSLTPAKLAVGTPGYVIRLSAGGIPEYVATFPLSNIAQTAATPYQSIRWNPANTAWEVHTPVFTKEYSDSAAGTLATGILTFAHGLAVMPKNARVVLVNVNTEGGWAVGDEIDFDNVHENVGNDNDGAPIGTWGCDSVNLTVNIRTVTSIDAVQKAVAATGFTLTAANWRIKVYAQA